LRVHVINLDRVPARFSEFAAVNPRLSDVSRYSAVDGQRLDIAALASRGLVVSDVLATYSTSTLGNALSHVGLWNAAIKSGTVLTVAEDDAIFNFGFDQAAGRVMGALAPDWDIVLWGFNFDGFISFEMLPGVSYCLGQFDQQSLRAGVAVFQRQAIAPQAFKLRWAFGTMAYSISPRGAQLFRDGLCPLRPIVASIPEGSRAVPGGAYFRSVGIDNAMSSLYPRLNAFVSFPPLVVSKNERVHHAR
jgi:glycosyl transferase family 25